MELTYVYSHRDFGSTDPEHHLIVFFFGRDPSITPHTLRKDAFHNTVSNFLEWTDKVLNYNYPSRNRGIQKINNTCRCLVLAISFCGSDNWENNTSERLFSFFFVYPSGPCKAVYPGFVFVEWLSRSPSLCRVDDFYCILVGLV